MPRLFSLPILMIFFPFTTSLQAQVNDADKSLPLRLYTQAWNEVNSDTRLKRLKTIWLKKSVYEDPAVKTKGPEKLNAMIDKFYKDFPNAVIEADPMLSKGDYYTWNWRIVNAKQKLIVTGRDVAVLDGKGHILKIIGFWEQDILANENVKTVTKYYECLFKTRDFTTLATLITPGAMYHQAEGLPYGGTFTGFENWMKMFIQASGLFDLQIETEPTYFLNGLKDGVIIRFTIKCTAKKSGNTIFMPIAEHFELNNGKITSTRPFYFDTQKFSEFLK